MTQPLILDAAGVTLTLLQLGESPKNIGVEFGSVGAESEEVSGLLLEEVLGERLEWKEHAVALGTAGRGSE